MYDSGKYVRDISFYFPYSRRLFLRPHKLLLVLTKCKLTNIYLHLAIRENLHFNMGKRLVEGVGLHFDGTCILRTCIMAGLTVNYFDTVISNNSFPELLFKE